MPSMVEVKCKRCKEPFMARTADRKRGWGKFCSKSCKAKTQEKRTGQCADYYHRQQGRDNNFRGSGVSKETYLHYANEYGGTPVFNRNNGDYKGFMDGGFDNTSCQNSYPDGERER